MQCGAPLEARFSQAAYDRGSLGHARGCGQVHGTQRGEICPSFCFGFLQRINLVVDKQLPSGLEEETVPNSPVLVQQKTMLEKSSVGGALQR